MGWVAPLQQPNCVDRETRACPLLEVADLDARALGHGFRSGEARLEWSHVLCAFLQWIAGRDQPPHLVQPKRCHRIEADAPVPGVGRVEGAAEKPDARHGLALAW